MVQYVYMQQMIFVLSFMHTIYCIWTGNTDTSTWFLPYHFVVPFSTETLWGWYILMFIQINLSVAYALCTVSVTSYFMCSCFYLHTICDHFDRLIFSANDIIKRRETPKNIQISYKQFKERFCQGIDIHIDIFE